MLRRLLYLLPILLAHAFCTQAQVYERGLLVLSNGDTLRGQLENGFWAEPPTFIHFRPTADSPGTIFKPRQLRAISFTKGRYFRYEALPIDHGAENRLNELPRGNYINVRTDSLLAEVLLDNPVTLLRVVRPGSVHYFLKRPDRPLLELCERQYLRQDASSVWRITEGNNYLDQLQLYFVDCPKARQVAREAPFTPQGLAAVVQAYCTACTPGQQPARSWLAQPRPARRSAFQGGVLAGVRYNHIESPAAELAGPCVDCLVHPFGGLYLEWLQPSRVTAVYGELTLSTYKSKGVLVSPTGDYTAFTYTGLLGTARVGIRYFLPLHHDQQLVLSFGLEYNRPLALDLPAAGTGTVVPGEASEAFASTTLLPNLGIGWRRQRLTLHLDGQFYTSTGSSDDIPHIFFDSNGALRLGISYRLGHNPDTSLAHPAAQP